MLISGGGGVGWRERETAESSPPLGMTKGTPVVPWSVVSGLREQQVPPLRFATVGMTILWPANDTPGPCPGVFSAVPAESVSYQRPWG
jgi:hypothetical protein